MATGGSRHCCAIGTSDKGEELLRTFHEGLLAAGIKLSLAKALRVGMGMPRCTACYEPIKAMIEVSPSFGDRTVAFLLGFNRNTVQRISQRPHWQVCKRRIGPRPRIHALPFVATAPNERWSNDLGR